jgi:hypothetical protein
MLAAARAAAFVKDERYRGRLRRAAVGQLMHVLSRSPEGLKSTPEKQAPEGFVLLEHYIWKHDVSPRRKEGERPNAPKLRRSGRTETREDTMNQNTTQDASEDARPDVACSAGLGRRRPVQMLVAPDDGWYQGALLVLCDDGTIWERPKHSAAGWAPHVPDPVPGCTPLAAAAADHAA